MFDWTSSPNSLVVHSAFWIYWVITISATVLVLGIWRTWYVFEEWRQSLTQKGRLYKDFGLWIRSWSKKQDENGDLEQGKSLWRRFKMLSIYVSIQLRDRVADPTNIQGLAQYEVHSSKCSGLGWWVSMAVWVNLKFERISGSFISSVRYHVQLSKFWKPAHRAFVPKSPEFWHLWWPWSPTERHPIVLVEAEPPQQHKAKIQPIPPLHHFRYQHNLDGNSRVGVNASGASYEYCFPWQRLRISWVRCDSVSCVDGIRNVSWLLELFLFCDRCSRITKHARCRIKHKYWCQMMCGVEDCRQQLGLRQMLFAVFIGWQPQMLASHRINNS